MIKISAPRAVLAVLLTGTMAAAGIGGVWEYIHRDKAATPPAESTTSADADDVLEELAPTLNASGNPVNVVPAIIPTFIPDIPKNATGDYLIAHFAQSQNDWRTASDYLSGVLKRDPNNIELIRRAMVLALGSGDFTLAAQRADMITKAQDSTTSEQDPLAYLILSSNAIVNGQYDEAIEVLNHLPKGDMAEFVVPLLANWARVGNGTYNQAELAGTTIHAYHGGLMAKYLKKDQSQIETFARVIIQPSGLTAEEYERAADLFALAGNTKEAMEIYTALRDEDIGSPLVHEKIEALKGGKDINPLLASHRITTPAQGAAQAVFDLARILFQENSDASARVFANMALGLDPNLAEARIILATSSARSHQYQDALKQFDKIPQTHPAWAEAQYAAADMLDQSGQTDEAVRRLRAMYDIHRDLDALARIGDIYRGHEMYDKALVEYNAAIDALGGDVTDEYWHLLYARGMCLEQVGDWPAAEKDLLAALKFRPDQPYLLNYLGYGWADQGKNLDQSLELIARALELQPNDGYITDSLGWVHYKFGQYPEAVKYLERAVELLPYDPTINDHLGDAYWAVGRKNEARFQWERARNFADTAEDADLIITLGDKLQNGLPPVDHTKPAIKAASTNPANTAQE